MLTTRLYKLMAVALALALAIGSVAATPTRAQSQTQTLNPIIRQITSQITTSFPVAGADGSGDFQVPEMPNEIREAEGAAGSGGVAPQGMQQSESPIVNRSFSEDSRHHGKGGHQPPPLTVPNVNSSAIAGANPGLVMSFNGLNFRQQRLANGGNQFSVEPPDQGLCVGNGYVLETVNDVLRVFDSAGTPLTGVIDLNTFYGYPAQFNRTTFEQGPFVTDPSCYFDPDTRRWFHVVLTLDVDPPSGDFLGSNHIDIAVSNTDNPTGTWTIYRLPVQDDGTDGTPNHGCSFGPCIGDFPHIGADKNGFYVTTNEYSLFGPEFKSAQIYAFSKSALASGASSVTVVQFDTTGAVGGVQPGFTVWPAIAPAARYENDAHGTEYFLSSNAAEEANGLPGGGLSDQIILWAMTNTRSLNSATPNLTLKNTILTVKPYGVPPLSDQKPGDFPLGQCINDTTAFGVGCWALFFLSEPAHDEVISHIDSSDSRMMQVMFANGKLWGALDTIVNVGGEQRAGIAFYIIEPEVEGHGRVDGEIVKQGYVAVAGNNVTYPAIAVLPNGKGIMGFTLLGQDNFPSAAYVSIDRRGTGDIHVAAAGLGPDDGFTSYKAFVGDPPRTRWGDYGAAVTDGGTIWIAAEYIAQTCTLAQYLTPPIGSCGGTRASLGNWATRITAVNP